MHDLVFITGASSGIGAALVRLIAAQKIALILTGRNETELSHLAEEAKSLGAPSVEFFAADLATKEGIHSAQESIRTHAPDLVINNAGFGLYGDVALLDLEKQQAIIDVNVSATFELSAVAVKTLLEREKEGVIMNISSMAAFPPFPGFAAYSASKQFVNHFSLCLDYEVRSKDIRVLVACPGVVHSKFRERAGGAPTTAQSPGVMTPEYAAQQIWWQIKKKKKLHIFNWRYRFLVWMTRILPNAIIAGLLHQVVQALNGHTEDE
ncbi:MAG: SDR family NAD(P)-dependent oxidoreductase [Parachlamydiales bacterium]|jgi:hypothetical protein